MARRIGTAFVGLEADATLFRASAVSGMKKALAGVEARVSMVADATRVRQAAQEVAAEIRGMDPEMNIGLDSKKLDAQLAAEYAKLATLQRKMSDLRIDAEDKAAVAKLAGLEAQAERLRQRLEHIDPDVNTASALMKIAGLEAQAGRLRARLVNMKTDVEMIAATRKMNALQAQADRLREGLHDMDADVETRAAQAKLAAVEAQIAELKSGASDIEVVAHATAIMVQMEVIRARIAELKQEAREIRIGPEIDIDAVPKLAALAGMAADLSGRLDSMRAEVKNSGALAQIAAMQLAVNKLTEHIGTMDLTPQNLGQAEVDLLRIVAAQDRLRGSLAAMDDMLLKTNNRWGWWIANIAAIKVPLYAGATATGAWHVALDALIETFAILVPAIVVAAGALTAFGLAGAETFLQIGVHLKNIGIIFEATGQRIPPLTGKFEDLAEAVRPQVFQLYGAALELTGRSMGLFGEYATRTGDALNIFFAKMIVNMKTGSEGIREFVDSGLSKLKQLGGIFSDLGKFIAYTVRVAEQTGIADMLLAATRAVTGLLAGFQKIPVQLTAFVLLIHGLYLWTGLAATAVVALLRGFVQITAVAAGAQMAGHAMKDLVAAGNATAVGRLGATFKDLATNIYAIPQRLKLGATMLFDFVKSGAGIATIGVLAAVGLAALILWLGRSKDATDKFIDSMDKMVAKASTFNVINATGGALIQTLARISSTQDQLTAATKKGYEAELAAATGVGEYAERQKQLVSDMQRLTGERDKLVGQLKTETSRLSEVSGKYGVDLPGAMALATLAGVKVETIVKGTNEQWAVAIQMIDDLVQGYANMGQGTGQLGADMNALTISGSNSVKAIKELNAAFDYFTSTVSAPVSSFISFDNALIRFAEDSKKADAHMTGLGDGAIGMSKKVTTASLQLQQDFIDAYTKGEQLFDAMRATAAPADAQVNAIKRVVEVLIPLAGNNKAAAAMVSALAQEAGGPATTNLQKLAEWAGKTADPVGALQKITNDAAVSFSNLSLDAQKLGTTLQKDLAEGMAKAVENAVGLQDALNKVATDIREGSTATAESRTHLSNLRDILTLVTGSEKDADAVISAMTGKLREQQSSIPPLQQAFRDWAEKGIGFSKIQSDDLWTVLTTKLGPYMSNDLAQTVLKNKTRFEEWAGAGGDSGLGLSKKQADALWAFLVNNLKPALNDMADNVMPKIKSKFTDWAVNGLDVSKNKANELWTQITAKLGPDLSKLGDLAGGTAKAKFVDWAQNALGLSRDKAMALWKEVQTLQSNIDKLHGKDLKINMEGSGVYVISQGKASMPIIAGSATGGQIYNGLVRRFDSGGRIRGPGGPRSDLAGLFALSDREWVIQASSAEKYGEAAMAAINAGKAQVLHGPGVAGMADGGPVRGMADGGKVSTSRLLEENFPKQMYDDFEKKFTASMVAAMREALKKAIAAGGAGSAAIVADAMSWLGKIPYVWGGTSLTSGADCSGFVQAIYGRHGIGAPRTSQAQGAWVKRTGPVPGGLAFYYSPAGGAPPGHVAIVRSPSQVISQGGGMGPDLQGIGSPMWTGIPPNGFDRGGWLPTGLSAAWNGTGKPERVLPASGAGSSEELVSRLDRVISGIDRLAEITAGIPVIGMATGGSVDATRKTLATAQAGEKAKYFGLTNSVRNDLKNAKKGSWTDRYRKTLTSVLGTLAKRQADELSAYAALSGAGLNAAGLRHLKGAANAEIETAKGQAITHEHPLWAADLRKYLGQLAAVKMPAGTTGGGSGGGSGGGGTGGGGTTTLGADAARKTLATAQAGEKAKYFGLTNSIRNDLKNAKKGSWTDRYRKTLTSVLGTLAKRQADELSAYAALAGAGLTASNLEHLRGAANAEIATAKGQAITHEHPLWAADLRKYLTQIAAIRLAPAATTGGGSGGGTGPTGPPDTTGDDTGTGTGTGTDTGTDTGTGTGTGTGGGTGTGTTAPPTFDLAGALYRLSLMEWDPVLTGITPPPSAGTPTGGHKPAPGHGNWWHRFRGMRRGWHPLVKGFPATNPWVKGIAGPVFDQGGWLAPGWNPPIYNGTGRPEPVGPVATAATADMTAELRAIRVQLVRLTDVSIAAPARTGQHVVTGLNTTAAAASFRTRYPGGGI